METADHSKQHSGHLALDSPAFFQFLIKKFPPSTRETFERLYAHLYAQGKVELATARSDRTPRFNPAPCRVASLLVSECKDLDSEHLLAAMAICLEEPELIKATEQISDEIKVLALETLAYLKEPKSANLIIERLGLALALDKIRHAHLSSMDSADQVRLCQWTQVSLISQTTAPENERLKLLLNTACTRILRLRGQSEQDS